MNYKFVWIDAASGQDLRSWIRTPPTQVGRGIFTDISIDSSSISRRHCEFFENESGQLMVRDLGSKNGILLNGKLVDQTEVPEGSQLTIGLVTLRIEPTDQPVDREQEQKEHQANHADETQAVKKFSTEDGRYEIG